MIGFIEVIAFALFCGILAGVIIAGVARWKGHNPWIWVVPCGLVVTICLLMTLVVDIMKGVVGLGFRSIWSLCCYFFPPYSSWLCWSGAVVWAIALFILLLLPKRRAGA